jgi:hypothetical protein
MLHDYDTYTIASHFVTAIEYGDYSGLEEGEEEALEAFLDTLPRGFHTWQWSDNGEEFATDEVTGLKASCITATLYVDSATA